MTFWEEHQGHAKLIIRPFVQAAWKNGDIIADFFSIIDPQMTPPTSDGPNTTRPGRWRPSTCYATLINWIFRVAPNWPSSFSGRPNNCRRARTRVC